ncbi:MAG TPA: TolC family protein [Candidatus Hydrogenedentes bacterium]|nr:TolC family protein [Candidatus Hydrogenedentota bacterium]HOL78225.1 TolC family protein [Candidatus Hydrogenedentota bacterium]HPO84530.1 TolC family protein [Candidatus Hydrogenedentota bacterium]
MERKLRTVEKNLLLKMFIICVFAPVSGGLLGGCSTTHYRTSADKETYKIIQEKSADVPNVDTEFTIEPAPLPSLEDLPKVTEADPALGEAAELEVNSYILSLEKALSIAVKRNRSYQNQKESLYLAALALTLDRHQYTPIFSGGGNAAYNRTTRDRTEVTTVGAIAQAAPDVVKQIGQLTGTPGELISRYSTLVTEAINASGLEQRRTVVVDERSVSGSSRLGVDLLLKGGAAIAVDLTSNFLRFLTGDPRVDTSSALVATITQPLMRGAGRRVAAERLTQAERDVLYALREYTRFRQEFTVDIASAYYNVLQARDAVHNNYASYLAFQASAERDSALVAEGRKRRSDLGRIEQARLNSENVWKNSIRAYRRGLDNFKIQLGLPTDAPIVLDQQELQRLQERGLQEWDIPVDDAVKVALATRLDLYNARDKEIDAERRVYIAANSLKPGLDLVVSGRVDSKEGDRFQELDFERARWSAGLNLDLPLNQKSKRNTYRAALIELERARRQSTLAEDTVKLQVRDAWRNLDQARITYEIRKIGVQINEERVQEQQLLAELGRGDALNLVDAQNDLTAARNELTSALISHTIARLQLWRDMGILFIKEDGQWQEVTDDVES